MLQVSVRWTDALGKSHDLPIGLVNGTKLTTWTSPKEIAGAVLPPGINLNVRFVFSSNANGGAWDIDDVFVDPYAK